MPREVKYTGGSLASSNEQFGNSQETLDICRIVIVVSSMHVVSSTHSVAGFLLLARSLVSYGQPIG